MAKQPFQDGHLYNDPHDTPSSIGPQIYVEYYYKRALVEAAKEQFFGQLADTTSMPKHFGKTLRMFHYLPILDDRNLNDQGIDADGVQVIADAVTGKTIGKATVMVRAPVGGLPAHLAEKHPYLPETHYFEGQAVTAVDGDMTAAYTAALLNAQTKAVAWAASIGITLTGADVPTAFGNLFKVPATDGSTDLDWTFEVMPADETSEMIVQKGNLYGSSKDVGTIVSKIPVLSETGGRVNRVGMKRITLEGTIDKYGIFEEYTQDSLDFDNDSELEMHITTEAVKAANEIVEDQLQLDLLNGAGVIRYAGDATSTAEIGGSTIADVEAGNSTADVVTYDDLVKLAIELDNNRTPKNTRLITGSRMIDTRVVNAARYMYVGSELLPTLMKMTDYHGEKAYIPVAQYGASTTLARGEHGAIHDFRIIVVPEMMHWEGMGDAAGDPSTQACYWGPDEAGAPKINVYPMLVIGDGSFTNIGFQTDGKSVKFKIKHVKPGSDISYSRHDPYGETGFYSIKWWYGYMTLRPERLALIKTAAYM